MIIFTIKNAKTPKVIVINGNAIYNPIGNGVGAINEKVKCVTPQTISVVTPTNNINNKLLMISIMFLIDLYKCKDNI